jgi:hypothetical protein
VAGPRRRKTNWIYDRSIIVPDRLHHAASDHIRG